MTTALSFQILPILAPYLRSEVKKDQSILKGIVQWIFLSTYVVPLVSRNTLLFTRTKMKQDFPRYRQKSAPTPKNTFLRFYSSLRKHPLAASPSDVTTLASMRKSGKGSGVVSPNGAKVNTNCDVTGGKIMFPACCFPSYCDFLDELFFSKQPKFVHVFANILGNIGPFLFR